MAQQSRFTVKNYIDNLVSTITGNITSVITFEQSISDVKDISNIQLSEKHRKIFNKLIYSHIITILETYLSDTFINTIMTNESCFKKFVMVNKDFKKRKLSLNEIYTRSDEIKKEVAEYLAELIYHNIAKVTSLYKDVLSINFPSLSAIYKAVNIRHDIVHRNGKTKDGTEINIDDSDIEKLINDVETFVKHINKHLPIVC